MALGCLLLMGVSGVFAKTVYWGGAVSGTWEVGTEGAQTGGWLDAPNGNITTFENGDSVTFEGLTANVVLTVKGAFDVGDLLFNTEYQVTLKSQNRGQSNGYFKSVRSFENRGTGTIDFNQFGGTWSCDMILTNGLFKTSKAVFSTDLAPTNTIFGDVSIPHVVRFGSGDPENMPGVVLAMPTGTYEPCLPSFMPQYTTIFDAAKFMTTDATMVFGKIVLLNGAIIYKGNRGQSKIFFRDDVLVKRRDDDQPSPAAQIIPSNNATTQLWLRGEEGAPINLIVEDVTSEAGAETPDDLDDLILGLPLDDCGLTGYAGPCSWVKKGNGRMKMTASSGLTGDITIEEGVVEAAPSASISSLGNMSNASRTITVESAGSLVLSSCLVGENSAPPLCKLILRDGAKLRTHYYVLMPDFEMYGSAQLTSSRGMYERGSICWGKRAYFELDEPVVFDAVWGAWATKDTIRQMRVSYQTDTYTTYVTNEVTEVVTTNRYGFSEMCIQKAKTHAPNAFVDLAIDLNLINHGGSYKCGLLKTGTGVLRLGGNVEYSNITKVREGGLWLTGAVKGADVVVESDGVIGGTGSVGFQSNNANLRRVRNLSLEGGGFLVDAQNPEAIFSVNGTMTMVPEGKIKLYNVEETDVMKMRFENLPFPSCVTMEGTNTLDAAAWKVEVDGFTPRQTRNLSVRFDGLGTATPTYSIEPRIAGTSIFIK